MQNRYTTGAVFHAEFSSADASAPANEAAARMTLYGAGSTTALTLGSNDNVVVTDAKVMVGAALTVTVYDGADAAADAGEVVTTGAYPANGGEAQNFSAPHVCQKGTYLHVRTDAAGAVRVQCRGYIFRTGV